MQHAPVRDFLLSELSMARMEVVVSVTEMRSPSAIILLRSLVGLNSMSIAMFLIELESAG
jgi:hypothetical protein